MAGKPWRWHHISMCKRLPEMDQRKRNRMMKYGWNMMEYCHRQCEPAFLPWFWYVSFLEVISWESQVLQLSKNILKKAVGSKHLGESNPNDADIQQNIGKVKHLFPRVVFQGVLENSATFHHFHNTRPLNPGHSSNPLLPRHC